MDKVEIKLKLRKNKLEMEYNDKMQIRQAFILVSIGVPFTIAGILINGGVSWVKIALLSLPIGAGFVYLTRRKSNELKEVRNKIDDLEKQFSKDNIS